MAHFWESFGPFHGFVLSWSAGSGVNLMAVQTQRLMVTRMLHVNHMVPSGNVRDKEWEKTEMDMQGEANGGKQ